MAARASLQHSTTKTLITTPLDLFEYSKTSIPGIYFLVFLIIFCFSLSIVYGLNMVYIIYYTLEGIRCFYVNEKEVEISEKYL